MPTQPTHKLQVNSSRQKAANKLWERKWSSSSSSLWGLQTNTPHLFRIPSILLLEWRRRSQWESADREQIMGFMTPESPSEEQRRGSKPRHFNRKINFLLGGWPTATQQQQRSDLLILCRDTFGHFHLFSPTELKKGYKNQTSSCCLLIFSRVCLWQLVNNDKSRVSAAVEWWSQARGSSRGWGGSFGALFAEHWHMCCDQAAAWRTLEMACCDRTRFRGFNRPRLWGGLGTKEQPMTDWLINRVIWLKINKLSGSYHLSLF